MPRKNKLSSNSLATVSKRRKINTPSPRKVAPAPSFTKDSPGDIMVQVSQRWQEISPRLKPQGPPQIVPIEQEKARENGRLFTQDMRRMQENYAKTTAMIRDELGPRGIAARDVWKALAQLDEAHAKGIDGWQRMNDNKRRLIEGDRQKWDLMKRSMDSLMLTPLPENVRAQVAAFYVDITKELEIALEKLSEVDAILKRGRAMYLSKKSPQIKTLKHQLVELLRNAPQPYSRRLASRVVHELLRNWNDYLAGKPGSLRTGSSKT